MTADRPVGAPALRAMAHAPVFVADVLVAGRLAAASAALASGGPASVRPDEPLAAARITRLVALALGAALVEHEEYGRRPAETIAVARPLAQLARVVGAPSGSVETALVALREAMVLAEAIVALEAVGPVARWRFTTTCLVETPAAVHLHWPTVLSALAGSGAALLMVRSLADLVQPVGQWAEVPLDLLQHRTGYSRAAVKAALARAVEAGVVERSRGRGRFSAYRFTAHAQGQAWERNVATPAARVDALVEPQGGAVPPHSSSPAGQRPVAVGETADRPMPDLTYVESEIGGVIYRVQPGVVMVVERGPDGRTRARFL